MGVFQRMTVRLHFVRRKASNVRRWSFLVPGMPLTSVMYRLGLHATGTFALNALNALIFGEDLQLFRLPSTINL